MSRPLLLFLLLVPNLVSSFSCMVCDGEDCLDPGRWIPELCPPGTNLCYRLTADDKVFRRGCAPNECTKMVGIPYGATCNTCGTDRCNGMRQAQVDHSGGGGVWSSSSASLPLAIVFLSLILTN